MKMYDAFMQILLCKYLSKKGQGIDATATHLFYLHNYINICFKNNAGITLST